MSWLKKFPSYDYLLKSAGATFMRFPFTLLSAAFGTIIAINLVDFEGLTKWPEGEKLLMAAALGLPLFTALATFAEKRQWKMQSSLGLQAVGLVMLVAYYFSLPNNINLDYMYVARFWLLSIGLHFLVAWLPYVGANQVQGFWQFNKSMFLRFFTAALYSAVMFIGLTTALGAADYLFGVNVPEERYFQLWVICAGFLHPWLFLAGIPERLEQLNNSIDYPKALKVFTQYILLPLVALYFVILISYEGKIIVTWNWPKGWVSQLVLWYSVVGILSMLLLYPLKDRAENLWITVFTKRFFWGLLPLVVMLFLSIFRRISDYGVTVPRYLVLVMAIGLIVVVLYFIVSKVKDIRIIPVVLSVLAFLSAFGPLSAFSVSERNQMGRLETMLTENNLMSDGVLQESPEPISLEARKEMSSIVDYLDNWYGLESFSVWISDSTINTLDGLDKLSRKDSLTREMGFAYLASWKTHDDARFSLHTNKSNVIDIIGYDYSIDVATLSLTETEDSVSISDGISCLVSFDTDLAILTIRLGDQADSVDAVQLHLADTVNTLLSATGGGELPLNQLSFDLVGNSFDTRVIIRRMSGNELLDRNEISHIKVLLLVRMH